MHKFQSMSRLKTNVEKHRITKIWGEETSEPFCADLHLICTYEF